MDAPEEPQPPVVYTMENKPIVTCKCGRPGGGRGRAGQLLPTLTQPTSDLSAGDLRPAVQPPPSFGSCPGRSGAARCVLSELLGIGPAFPVARLFCALTSVRWAGPALRRAQVLFL